MTVLVAGSWVWFPAVSAADQPNSSTAEAEVAEVTLLAYNRGAADRSGYDAQRYGSTRPEATASASSRVGMALGAFAIVGILGLAGINSRKHPGRVLRTYQKA